MLDLDAIEKRTEVVGTIILPNGEQVPLENFIESLQIPLLIAEVERLRGELEEIRNLEGQEGMTDSKAIKIALEIANKSQ